MGIIDSTGYNFSIHEGSDSVHYTKTEYKTVYQIESYNWWGWKVSIPKKDPTSIIRLLENIQREREGSDFVRRFREIGYRYPVKEYQLDTPLVKTYINSRVFPDWLYDYQIEHILQIIRDSKFDTNQPARSKLDDRLRKLISLKG